MQISASMLIYTQVYNSEVTLIDWNLLSNFSDFPRAVVRKRKPRKYIQCCMVLDKQVAANTLIHSSEVTLIDWELAEKIFRLSESS